MRPTGFAGISLAVLLVALIAGCIFTATVVITASIVPDADGEPVVISNSDSTEKLRVDLRADPTFDDYKDDIKNIESIGFYLSAENQFFTDATFQLFLEGDTTRNYTSAQGLVDSLVQLVLTDLVIPARSQVVVDWNESIQYIDNLEEFKEVLAAGVFDIYPSAFPRDNFKIKIDSLVVIVTLTGSK